MKHQVAILPLLRRIDARLVADPVRVEQRAVKASTRVLVVHQARHRVQEEFGHGGAALRLCVQRMRQSAARGRVGAHDEE